MHCECKFTSLTDFAVDIETREHAHEISYMFLEHPNFVSNRFLKLQNIYSKMKIMDNRMQVVLNLT